jgi:hypothetical protein
MLQLLFRCCTTLATDTVLNKPIKHAHVLYTVNVEEQSIFEIFCKCLDKWIYYSCSLYEG